MKEKLRNFMIGRYGTDQLNRFLVAIAFVMIVLNLFVNSDILYFLILADLVLCYWRTFSRNTGKRYAENQKYMGFQSRFTGKFKKQKYWLQQNKDNHIYSCPKCKQKIRVPRGKGKISIHCPNCGQDFVKNS